MEKLTYRDEVKRTYSVLLDIDAAKNIANAQEKEKLQSLIRTNLETSLGERFNAELFGTSYTLQSGKLYHPTYNEPFLERMAFSQQFRQLKGSSEVQREKAEVRGFGKVEEILASSHPEPVSGSEEKILNRVQNDTTESKNLKVIHISPQGKAGSIYEHNFFDVYEIVETPKQPAGLAFGEQSRPRGFYPENTPNVSIRMSRYSSYSSLEEFKAAVDILDPKNNLPDSPIDSDFLENPITTHFDLEEIKGRMNLSKETIPLSEYKKLLGATAQIVEIYVENPSPANYNALLKFADVYMEKDTSRIKRDYLINLSGSELTNVLPILAMETIRDVPTACGISRGYELGVFKPFSVIDSIDNLTKAETEKTLCCTCPFCNRQVEAEITNGTISCPKCGKSAPYSS